MNRFEKGSGVYTCSSCGIRTRETGYGEADVKLCAFCYQEGVLYNALSDGEIAEDYYVQQTVMLKRKYNRSM